MGMIAQRIVISPLILHRDILLFSPAFIFPIFVEREN